MSKHHAIFLHYNALTKEGGPDVCKNDFSFGALNFFLAGLMKYCSTMHFTFPKRPITQLRGHSTTTWTEFCYFFDPPTLRGQFYTQSVDKNRHY